MRKPRLSASLTMVVVLAGGAGTALAATPKKPADHHGYRWGAQKLLCTSVRSERRPNDKVVITFKGKRYWCSKPAAKVWTGTDNQAQEAVRVAYQEMVNPGVGGMFQGFTVLDCTGGPSAWRCLYQTAGFAGSATVTFTAKGPKVVFVQG